MIWTGRRSVSNGRGSAGGAACERPEPYPKAHDTHVSDGLLSVREVTPGSTYDKLSIRWAHVQTSVVTPAMVGRRPRDGDPSDCATVATRQHTYKHLGILTISLPKIHSRSAARDMKRSERGQPTRADLNQIILAPTVCYPIVLRVRTLIVSMTAQTYRRQCINQPNTVPQSRARSRNSTHAGTRVESARPW